MASRCIAVRPGTDIRNGRWSPVRSAWTPPPSPDSAWPLRTCSHHRRDKAASNHLTAIFPLQPRPQTSSISINIGLGATPLPPSRAVKRTRWARGRDKTGFESLKRTVSKTHHRTTPPRRDTWGSRPGIVVRSASPGSGCRAPPQCRCLPGSGSSVRPPDETSGSLPEG